MDFNPILPPERIAAHRAAGHWKDRLIVDYVDEAVAMRPDHVAIRDFNSTTGRATSISYRQLKRLSDRMALGMVALGIEPGDIVSFQLPNWWHVEVLYVACVRIGAVINPLMPIFRHRELTFMLGFNESRLLLVPRRFRGFDHPGMIAELRGDLPHLKHVLVVEGTGETSLEAVLLRRRWEDELDGEAIFRERRPSPNAVTEMLYTSGTTGQPKGVMQIHNTLLHNVGGVIEQVGLTDDDVILMSSPLAHNTGFLFGLLMPLMLHSKVVLQDIWEPVGAAQRIQDERVTFTMGSTPFLQDLTHAPGVERYDTGSLRVFVTAGAPIPRVLVQAATEKFRMRVVSGWGMSENGLATTTRQGDPPQKVFETDGAPIAGIDVRVVDENTRPVPVGVEGRLQVRGASQFVGYLRKPELHGTDAEGWFETGDNARMDADGYIRISGRSKDIIIRGGENVPVVEVEELLYRHPAVQDCAIVAMPDERLGERGCCYVVPRKGQTLTFQEMVAYLESCRLAKNYFPERLELIDAMPRTPSGKIQKFKLRAAAAELPQG
ncbi:MAG: AMP-binding protein [Candidatus Lambdaproteobacteria bacterium]|nr:AMP-binding protein [Candidatus Lambdaproteobacteria bacterium]